MLRRPVNIPAKRGVYALVNSKRHFAYVGYSQNMQKRSHSMSHMLLAYDADRKAYWPIKDLPKYPSGEYTFVVLAQGVAPERALSAVAVAQRGFLARKFALIRGNRIGSPVVTVNGRRQSLHDAVAEAPRSGRNGKLKYATAYRRLQRGWTVRQALGLDDPDPRWNADLQDARRRRSETRRVA